MDISIIVCTYNRSELTRKMLESMERLVIPQGLTWEVLIIDDSADNTNEVVSGFIKKKRIPVNYMFQGIKNRSAGLNKGIITAKGENLVFIDSDMELDKYYIEAVLRAVREYPDINVFGGRVLINWPFPKPGWVITEGAYQNIDATSSMFDGGDQDRNFLELHKLPTIGNAFFRRKILEGHFFREDLGPSGGKMGYWEDTEFFLRFKNNGEKIMYIKGALTYHNVEAYKISKRYFLQREYEMGLFDVKRQETRADGVYYSGIPRYLFRKMAKNFFLWFFSLSSNRRFFYKLKLYYTFGEIRGYAKNKRNYTNI